MAITTCINPNAGEGYDPNQWTNDQNHAEHVKLAHEVSWEGLVLGTGEHNGYDDSDFYALVWDEKTDSVIEIEYASTRSWTYHNNAQVDATPEVISRAVAWKAQQLAEKYTADTIAEKLRELTQVDKGMEVRSLTTRGKNKGLVGVVKWVGKDGYKSTRDNTVLKFGIAVEGEDKLRYLSEDQVERTDLPEDMGEATKLTAKEIGGISRHAISQAQSLYLRG